MMRRAAVSVIFVLLLAACGEPAAQTVVEWVPDSSGSVFLAAPAWDPDVDDGPRYEGFGSLSMDAEQLVARVRGETQIYNTPNASDEKLMIPAATILGTTTVLAVVEEAEDGWLEVMLPVRPNESTGFVQEDDVELYVVDGAIVVDLTERTLTYIVGDDVVVTSTVAIGSSANPTPTGQYFVTDNVTLANPNSPWGPHAFGLSARSETITEYNGGDGIIGIHGTSSPGSIGRAVSLGCVRLPNDVITMLHKIVPLGTPVEIKA